MERVEWKNVGYEMTEQQYDSLVKRLEENHAQLGLVVDMGMYCTVQGGQFHYFMLSTWVQKD